MGLITFCDYLNIANLVFLAVLLIYGILKKRRSAIIAGSVGVVLSAAILLEVIFRFRYHPVIKAVTVLGFTIALLLILIVSLRKKWGVVGRFLSGITAIIGSVFLCMTLFFGAFGVRYTEVEGVRYLGVYDLLTGIGPTHVIYYRSSGPLITAADPEFYDDYGPIFSEMVTEEILNERYCKREYDVSSLGGEQ